MGQVPRGLSLFTTEGETQRAFLSCGFAFLNHIWTWYSCSPLLLPKSQLIIQDREVQTYFFQATDISIDSNFRLQGFLLCIESANGPSDNVKHKSWEFEVNRNQPHPSYLLNSWSKFHKPHAKKPWANNSWSCHTFMQIRHGKIAQNIPIATAQSVFSKVTPKAIRYNILLSLLGVFLWFCLFGFGLGFF